MADLGSPWSVPKAQEQPNTAEPSSREKVEENRWEYVPRAPIEGIGGPDFLLKVLMLEVESMPYVGFLGRSPGAGGRAESMLW